ncbi:AAA family ATPase [Candidatus Babela massiliensis]|uniref:MoxR-like ATPase n=1 Tax=Candidatus Babela massiliensis TaxID=673862 RepID=V6DGN0_9BACT|nr:MoxR family ATPase [Candidatus Babela massiliensis]CDK30709.1 MoxR-like ATPase [Candidatus Babela massiliensis]
MLDIISQESNKFQHLLDEVHKTIIGQEQVLTFMILGTLCNGHILLEGVPGVAKTTMIKALTKAMGLTFKRIQFTPDLLPSDLIGTLIYNPKNQEFETKKGPIFANLILADEINRAPAKVQAALLEAMQEQQVTIGSTTYELDKPFIVFATQNPLEQEGTYRLPEAQLDRFMFKLNVDYPTMAEEKTLLTRDQNIETLNKIIEQKDILDLQELIGRIYIDQKIINYITEIIFATRKPEFFKLQDIKKYITYGVSPRATLALAIASKAYAFFKKRHFVTPDDVKTIALPVLRHRLILTYEAEAENINSDQIIRKILATIPVP